VEMERGAVKVFFESLSPGLHPQHRWRERERERERSKVGRESPEGCWETHGEETDTQRRGKRGDRDNTVEEGSQGLMAGTRLGIGAHWAVTPTLLWHNPGSSRCSGALSLTISSPGPGWALTLGWRLPQEQGLSQAHNVAGPTMEWW
jgi:hypothetical protein